MDVALGFLKQGQRLGHKPRRTLAADRIMRAYAVHDAGEHARMLKLEKIARQVFGVLEHARGYVRVLDDAADGGRVKLI